MRELEEQRRQERAERLADEAEHQRQRDDDEQDIDYNTDRSADEDYTDRRGYGDNDDDLPTYKRTPYLIRDKATDDDHGNGSNEPDRSFNRGRLLDDESSEKLAEKRHEARSQVLKSSATPKPMPVDDDKLQHRNFDEAVHHQEQITQDEEKELDKEL